jgi:hypothetical protein
MPSRLPGLPSAEPLDLRIALVFVALTVVLVAPGVMNGLSPLGDAALKDAASTLQSQAREAVAVIERRDRVSALAFSAELQDLGNAAQEIRADLLREAVDASLRSQRDRVAESARQIGDAADDASVAADDRAQLDRDRVTLGKLVRDLDNIGGGS